LPLHLSSALHNDTGHHIWRHSSDAHIIEGIPRGQGPGGAGPRPPTPCSLPPVCVRGGHDVRLRAQTAPAPRTQPPDLTHRRVLSIRFVHTAPHRSARDHGRSRHACQCRMSHMPMSNLSLSLPLTARSPLSALRTSPRLAAISSDCDLLRLRSRQIAISRHQIAISHARPS